MSLSDYPVTSVIAVSDLRNAKVFYERVLGLRRSEKQPGAEFEVLYDCANGGKLQVYASPASEIIPSGSTLVTWEVPDLERAVQKYQEDGLVFEEYDFPGFQTVNSIVTDEDGTKAAWFKDPDGNILCLHQVA